MELPICPHGFLTRVCYSISEMNIGTIHLSCEISDMDCVAYLISTTTEIVKQDGHVKLYSERD